MESGLFEVKERTIDNPDGKILVTRTTKVTGAIILYKSVQGQSGRIASGNMNKTRAREGYIFSGAIVFAPHSKVRIFRRQFFASFGKYC
jgi:hypothetical protein